MLCKHGLLFLFSLSIAFAKSESKPNLLFIMTDQQRFDAMNAAGNSELKTPNMDRIAKEGVMFRNCYSGNPVCVPSRAIMLTGRSSENVNVTGNGDIDHPNVPDVPTFDSLLSENGYTVEYYGKWHTPNQFLEPYDNNVLEISENVRAYREWLLSEGVSPLEPGTGQLYNKRNQRPYTPIELDANYDFAFTATVEEKMKLKAKEGSQYGKLDLPANVSYSAFTAEKTLDALDRLQGGPFTLTCSFGPPHPPLVVQDPYFSMFPAADIAVPASINDTLADSPYSSLAGRPSDLPYKVPKNVREMRQIYYGMVREVDDQIGKIIDKLDNLGLTESTLVIFTSDHGEMLGDHGLHSKFVFYEGSVRVPLLMRFPRRIKPGTIVEDPVSGMDMFSTILDYMDLSVPESNGLSLRAFIEGKPVPHDVVSSTNGSGKNKPTYMIRSGEFKLMISYRSSNDMSAEALYDLSNDPLELKNLIHDNPPEVKLMMRKFVAWLKRHEPEKSPPVAKGKTLSSESVLLSQYLSIRDMTLHKT